MKAIPKFAFRDEMLKFFIKPSQFGFVDIPEPQLP
jgi:hypothetical protein